MASKMLRLSIAHYCLFFLIYIFTDFQFDSRSIYGNGLQMSFIVEILLAVIIAPIIEELIFRIPLIKKRPFYLFGFLLFFLIIILLRLNQIDLQTSIIFVWITYLVFVKFISKKTSSNFLNYLSITLFAISHLQIENIFSFSSLTLMIFYFAGGCLLTWFILNYGAVKTIVFHSVYNIIGISIYMLSLNYFYDDTLKSSCLDNVATCIEWKQRAIFGSNQAKLGQIDKNYVAENATIKNILDLMTIVDIEEYDYVIMHDSKIKYDIKIYNKDHRKLNDSIILKSLENSGLIKIQKKNTD